MSDDPVTSPPLTLGSSPVAASDFRSDASSEPLPEVTQLRTNDGADETQRVIDDNSPIKLTTSDEKEFTVPYKTVSVFAFKAKKNSSSRPSSIYVSCGV